MEIDFKQGLKNFEGEILKDSSSGKEITLGYICTEALLSNEKDSPVDAQEKIKRFNLASDIYKGDKKSLTAEEVVLLKELIGRMYSIIIVGQAYPMLEVSA